MTLKCSNPPLPPEPLQTHGCSSTCLPRSSSLPPLLWRPSGDQASILKFQKLVNSMEFQCTHRRRTLPPVSFRYLLTNSLLPIFISPTRTCNHFNSITHSINIKALTVHSPQQRLVTNPPTFSTAFHHLPPRRGPWAGT